jgi:hypothetical protein
VSEGEKRENMGEEKVDLGGKVSLSGKDGNRIPLVQVYFSPLAF